MSGLGIICGMEAEAAALGPWREDLNVSVRISGARPDRAEAQARDLATQGATALLSWGIAGALAPGWANGKLIRPAAVLAPGGKRYEVSLRPGTDGVLVGMDHLILEPAEKKGLRAASGALAVDMESHRVAKVACESGMQFGVIRVVSDPADRSLPKLAETALDEAGQPRFWHVLMGLMRRPRELPALIRAGQDSKNALAVLAQAAREHIPETLKHCS